MPEKNLGVWGETPTIKHASQTPIFVGMEDLFSVGAVKVKGAIRFYTVRSSQKEACEKELAQQGMSVMVWGEDDTEHAAMARAMQLVALQMADRSK